MKSDIYWINEDKIGTNLLGTMARPRGNDWLEDEIKWLKYGEINYLISLLEPSEVWELGLEKEAEICKKWGIEFINFPIKDVHTPNNENEFLNLVEELVNQIKNGKKIVIHCRMGIGRASMLAAAILIKLGFKGKEIFEIISKHRKVEVPDTEEQKNWVLGIEKQLR